MRPLYFIIFLFTLSQIEAQNLSQQANFSKEEARWDQAAIQTFPSNTTSSVGAQVASNGLAYATFVNDILNPKTYQTVEPNSNVTLQFPLNGVEPVGIGRRAPSGGFIVAATGIYNISTVLSLTSNVAGGSFFVALYKGDNFVTYLNIASVPFNAVTALSGETLISLAAGDMISIRGRTTNAAITLDVARLTITKIAP
jgi:hypothetical protein